MFYKRRVRKKPFIRDFIFRDQRALNLLRRSANLVFYSGTTKSQFPSKALSSVSPTLWLTARQLAVPLQPLPSMGYYLWSGSAHYLLFIYILMRRVRILTMGLPIVWLGVTDRAADFQAWWPGGRPCSAGPISPRGQRKGSWVSSVWWHVTSALGRVSRYPMLTAFKAAFMYSKDMLVSSCATILAFCNSLLRRWGIGLLPKTAISCQVASTGAWPGSSVIVGSLARATAAPRRVLWHWPARLIRQAAFGRRYESRIPWHLWRRPKAILRWRIYPLQRVESQYGSPLWGGNLRRLSLLFSKQILVSYRLDRRPRRRRLLQPIRPILDSTWAAHWISTKSWPWRLTPRYQGLRLGHLRVGLDRIALQLEQSRMARTVRHAIDLINELGEDDILDGIDATRRLRQTQWLLSRFRRLYNRGIGAFMRGARARSYLSRGRWAVHEARGGFGGRLHELLTASMLILKARQYMHRISKMVNWSSYISRGLHHYPEIGIRAYNIMMHLRHHLLKIRDGAYKRLIGVARLYWDNYQIKGWMFGFNRGYRALQDRGFLARTSLGKAYSKVVAAKLRPLARSVGSLVNMAKKKPVDYDPKPLWDALIAGCEERARWAAEHKITPKKPVVVIPDIMEGLDKRTRIPLGGRLKKPIRGILDPRFWKYRMQAVNLVIWEWLAQELVKTGQAGLTWPQWVAIRRGILVLLLGAKKYGIGADHLKKVVAALSVIESYGISRGITEYDA